MIRAHLGFRELGQPEVALGTTRWLLGRVWHRDERPEVLQELLVARLRREKVLLHAVNTLERLVARCRARMERRLWRRLARLPSPDDAMRLENLLAARATA